MRADVASDLVSSSDAFKNLVWPVIAPDLRDGEFSTVESVSPTGFAKDLDVLAGIDGWQVCRHLGTMRGIACRVQFTDMSWDTFTIRYKRSTGAETEYMKRTNALRDPAAGWLMPALTVQAYVSKDKKRVVGACVVRTADLFGYTEKWLPDLLAMPKEEQVKKNSRLYMKANGSDGNLFVVVPWTGLAEDGVKLMRRPLMRGVK